MRVCISNIAWSNQDEPEVASLLAELGVRHVEVAPTKIWPSLPTAPDAELDAYRAFWRDHGIEISAMQALLYGREDLQLFGSAALRRDLLEYLRGVFRVGARLGAGPLVFGSPKNRLRGTKTPDEAHAIALEFFAAAGSAARAEGTELCIEPNPPAYGCDWITTSEEAVRLVHEVDTAGFGLHLDAAGMHLAGEDGPTAIRRCRGDLRHFHISEPQLGPVGEGSSDHAGLAAALREVSYAHVASVEMRHDASRNTARELRRVLDYVLRVYGPNSPSA